MVLPVVLMLLAFGYAALAIVRSGGRVMSSGNFITTTTKDEEVKQPVAFDGGMFEASGVVHVPDSDGVLFVDDGRPDEVFWMRLGDGRSQAGAIKAVKLGTSVIDLEGITTDGSHFYVVGSQSKAKGGDLAGLVRFRFDARGRRAEGVEAISALKRLLSENVAELRGMDDRKYRDGGINIEGIAWDPHGRRFLLGLRSPVIEGQALVVPVRLRDSRGAFSYDNLAVEGGKAIRLPLGGAGIRSIEYDERVKAFRILSGAAANAEKANFKLWEWDGDVTQPMLREAGEFDRKLKPEGITRVTTGGRDFTFIVFDTSGYAAMN
ncbi:MAG TPA: DUF3616 domain-containing protein [Pyrinomonadaceae bacterium]